MVRIFLENDAMINARYLAKEYMEEKKISSQKEIEKLVAGFDKINKIGMPYIHYYFFAGILIKMFILLILCLIF